MKKFREQPFMPGEMEKMRFFSPNKISNSIEKTISEYKKLETNEEKWAFLMRYIDGDDYLSKRLIMSKSFLNQKYGTKNTDSTDPYDVLENLVFELAELIKHTATELVNINEKHEFEFVVRLIPNRARLHMLKSYTEINNLFRSESGLIQNFERRRKNTGIQLKSIINSKNTNYLNKYIRLKILNRRISIINESINKMLELENWAYSEMDKPDVIKAIRKI